jgi:hypothetical protein
VKIFGVKLGPGIEQDPSSLFSGSVCGCTRLEQVFVCQLEQASAKLMAFTYKKAIWPKQPYEQNR